MAKDYNEESEEAYDDLEKEQKELLEIEKEQSTEIRNGQVEFARVNHSERAEKFKRASDGDITEYANISLEYFGYRCALSGERFVTFDEKVDGKKHNLSAEHVVALCSGGDDIVPNIVPTVLQYNIRKNGYYLLDYWDKQKDTEGKSLYSPYRLLKLVNYMMKSIEARGLSVEEYRKAIMTPNEIDKLLAEIEKQDELEPDNSNKKIHSNTITATTLDEDNKKILTDVPLVEGNIPTAGEQQEKHTEIKMMDIFLSDAVGLLKREQELQQVKLQDKDGNEISLQDKLDGMLENSINEIRFEVEVRNAVLQKLEALGIQNNKYSVANDLIRNTEILDLSKENREQVDVIVENYFENQLSRIRDAQVLSEEQLKTVISNMPLVIYDEKEISKIKLWSKYRGDSFEDLISRDYTATDTFVDVLIILKTKGIDLSEIKPGQSKIGDLIRDSNNAELILTELQGISEEITIDWTIGRRLNKQKEKNILRLKDEIEKTGIELTEKERKKILEIEKAQEKSERVRREFVQVLSVLKENGVDLSNIGGDISTIEQLIRDNEKKEEIIKQLQKISKEITGEWRILSRLNTQKKGENIQKLKEEIENAGIELTDKEIKIVLEKESNQEYSDRTRRELVEVLVILKKNGIDLSLINIGISTIEDLIKDNNNAIFIIEELQEISDEITKEWRIGAKLSFQKNEKNFTKLQDEIEMVGLNLTEKEKKKILEKETRQEESERITREFVQVLVILKKYRIDVSNITNSSKIQDLIIDNENIESIQEELQEISDEITEDWQIGQKLITQRYRNMSQLKREIEKVGLILTKKEEQKILESKDEKSDRIIKEFVQVLEILKSNGIDLSQIKGGTSTIEDLIKENENVEVIMEKLQEISDEITGNWPIGERLSNYKYNKMTKLEEEIEAIGLELSSSERKKILEKETLQEESERKIIEYVQVLVVLKNNGVNLSQINIGTSTIEDLIKNNENVEAIMEELQEISNEITNDWPIGERTSYQKHNNLPKIEKQIERVGLKLTDAERKKLLQIESKRELSERMTKEFVQVLEILKNHGIDLSKIEPTTNIENLIGNNELLENITQELQEISPEITKDWPIGNKLQNQRMGDIKQFAEELNKVGVNLTKKEQKRLLEIEDNKAKSDRLIKEFVQVLIVLKNNGINLSDIKVGQRGSTIEDLISDKENTESILKELQNISDEITKEWNIGGKLSTQKNNNMLKLKQEIEAAGINLTEKERKILLEKENNQEKSERITRELVQVLVVLKTNRIDLSEIIVGKSKIDDLIKGKDKEEQKQIIKELQEISEEITKDWSIGVKLNTQKTLNMPQLERIIDESGIQLTSEEKQKILEIKEQMSRTTTKEFVQVLVVLKTNEIDLSKIVQIGRIEDLIKEKDEEEQKQIIKELQEISEEITRDWPIGSKLNTQKNQNMSKLKNEIEKAGIQLMPEEQKKILEKESTQEKSERITREVVQGLLVLKRNGIDLSKIVQGTKIENLIKGKDKEEQKQIIKELQEISEEITEDWTIGKKLQKQKTNNMERLKKEIEEAGIKLTPEEQKKILEKESAQEKSKRLTKEFVQALVVLRANGIDLSEIIVGKSKIEDLIKGKNEEEQDVIINELQEISEEMTKDWSIGTKLKVQKRNIEQLKEEIKETGIELTEEEQQKILGKSVQKKVKKAVVEQKNKGELGQNQQIEAELFEETIRQAEQAKESEVAGR